MTFEYAAEYENVIHAFDERFQLWCFDIIRQVLVDSKEPVIILIFLTTDFFLHFKCAFFLNYRIPTLKPKLQEKVGVQYFI